MQNSLELLICNKRYLISPGVTGELGRKVALQMSSVSVGS